MALAKPSPKPRQQWDITVALLACTPEGGGLNQHPAAAMTFSDPQGQRWQRSFDGALTRIEHGPTPAGEFLMKVWLPWKT